MIGFGSTLYERGHSECFTEIRGLRDNAWWEGRMRGFLRKSRSWGSGYEHNLPFAKNLWNWPGKRPPFQNPGDAPARIRTCTCDVQCMWSNISRVRCARHKGVTFGHICAVLYNSQGFDTCIHSKCGLPFCGFHIAALIRVEPIRKGRVSSKDKKQQPNVAKDIQREIKSNLLESNCQ
jgi:hypothetical protein